MYIDTTYGYNTGYGINTGGDNSAGVPDVIDIKVHFSEAVKASCGADNDQWVFQEHYMGLYYRVCAQIKLVLVTIDDTNGMNDNSTTGLPGEPIFPTGFLYETGSDPPTVLNFRWPLCAATTTPTICSTWTRTRCTSTNSQARTRTSDELPTTNWRGLSCRRRRGMVLGTPAVSQRRSQSRSKRHSSWLASGLAAAVRLPVGLHL